MISLSDKERRIKQIKTQLVSIDIHINELLSELSTLQDPGPIPDARQVPLVMDQRLMPVRWSS